MNRQRVKKDGVISFRIDWQACIRCGACVAVCPLQAGFITPFDTIAVERPCGVACLACENICPVSAIRHYPAADEEIAAHGVATEIPGGL